MKTAGLLLGAPLAFATCLGQDLTPRASVITPVHSNAIIVMNSLFSGNLMFNGMVPVTDATAKVNVPIVQFQTQDPIAALEGHLSYDF